MCYRELAEDFCQMRIQSARKMSRVEEALSAKGEANVMLFLSTMEEEVLAGQIARQLGLSASRITNILNSLEKKGLIQKHTDASDKRRVYISLTDSGRDFFRERQEEVLERYASLFRKLGAEDTKNYLRILKKLDALMDEEIALHPPGKF